MSDEISHDQLIADMGAIGIPDAANIATKDELKKHTHSEVSLKVKVNTQVLIFENGILTKVSKEGESPVLDGLETETVGPAELR